MKITIKELSDKSGYSVSTISRVLANKENVKKETRQAIERLLIENNYRSGSYNTRVAKGVQKLVLIVVNDIANQFYVKTLQKMQELFVQEGLLPLIAVSENIIELEEKYVSTAQDIHLAAIVLMTPMESENLKKLISGSRVPVVLANRYLRSLDTDVVCVDNYRGGYMATEYLLQHGLRKIYHVAGYQNSTASNDRRRGFSDALRDHQIIFNNDMVYQGNMKRSGGQAFAEYYLKNRGNIEGVFFANDMMTTGFLDVLYEKGLRVPDDVSVICFDDSPAVTEGHVKVTTVSIDANTIGEQVASIVMQRINGIQSKVCKIIFPPTIQKRESVKKVSPLAE